MSGSMEETIPASELRARDPAGRRPLRRRLTQLLRRGHLYLGLFLIPWVLLYGVTAFLFNHPDAFGDSAIRSTHFDAELIKDLPVGNPRPLIVMAGDVVQELSRRGGVRYRFVPEVAPRYAREHLFATIHYDDGRSTGLLLDVLGHGGTVRPNPPVVTTPPAPFAIGRPPAPPAPPGKGEMVLANSPERMTLPGTIVEALRQSEGELYRRLQIPLGFMTITSVPDLIFAMDDAEGKRWEVSYNALNGTVTGKPYTEPAEISTRRFLTRLHLAHGYPFSANARWFWAVIVDVMAGVMVFWAVTGLVMWWQVKSTRKLGILAIALSVGVATALGLGMHAAIRG